MSKEEQIEWLIANGFKHVEDERRYSKTLDNGQRITLFYHGVVGWSLGVTNINQTGISLGIIPENCDFSKLEPFEITS